MSGSRLSKVVAFAAVAASLLILVPQADARVGGGGSSGSRGGRTFSAPAATNTAPTASPFQRSATQPSVNRPGTVGQGGGFFNRPGMGMLGGLAAGFLGAGLLGMMFGGGLSGGLGGIASFFGLLLQIGLIVIVARLAWSWWQRRNQPAMASGPGNAPMARNPLGGMFGGGMGAGLGGGGGSGVTAPASQPIEIGGQDFEAFETLLGEIQTAYGAEDLNAIRAKATPEMVSYFSEDLASNASQGFVNRISGVKLLQGDLSEAWRENGAEYATVAMKFALVDQKVDRDTGHVMETGPAEATELWTFRRVPGGAWMLSAIQQV